MNSFDAVVFLWLASAVLATAIGCFRGRAADAMNLGILLGPIGVLLVLALTSEGRFPRNQGVPILNIGESDFCQRAAAAPETELRKAA